MTLKNYITTIENACRDTSLAIRKEHRLLIPRMTDYDLIPEIYQRFKELDIKSDFSRRVFILVIVSLYSPKSFVGRKLNEGLRDRLAKLFNCERSMVSHLMRNTIFWYKNDKAYQDTVNMVLEKLGYSDF